MATPRGGVLTSREARRKPEGAHRCRATRGAGCWGSWPWVSPGQAPGGASRRRRWVRALQARVSPGPPAVCASDLVLEPARLPPGTRSPSSLPSASGLADPVLRPIHQDVRLPPPPPAFLRLTCLALRHAPVLDWSPSRARQEVDSTEAREHSQEALGNSSSAAACLLSSLPSGLLAWPHQDARQAGGGKRVSE